jgi:regulatory protein
MNKEEKQKVIQRLSRICMRGEKCEQDIKKKLVNWKVPGQDHNDIIDFLKKEDFIDHRRYSNAFVNDKIKFHHWGRQKIRAYLRNKEIEEENIEASLNKISQKYYDETLKKELAKKKERLSKLPDKETKRRLVNYLVQKGFEYGKVFEFVESEIKKDNANKKYLDNK